MISSLQFYCNVKPSTQYIVYYVRSSTEDSVIYNPMIIQECGACVTTIENVVENLDKAYIRILLEVPEDRIEDPSNKIWSWSSDCPFKKVDILCRWCQFAEGNEIPQAVNDGKPKDLLTGSVVRRRPWSGYMTNVPVCLWNR